MSRARLAFAPLLLAAALALALAGCGSKAGGTDSGAASTPPAGTPAPDLSASVPSAVPLHVGVELGEKVFKQRCVLCHGPEGRGNGPASAALKPPPRNFHDAAYMKTRTDEQLLTSIRDGKSAMPPWGKVLSDEEIRSALMFVREFAGKP